jgi:hypothetical protein
MAGGAGGQKGRMGKSVFYVGRLTQLIGMWLLLVDIVMAGPMGPDPKLFAAGVALFIAGWGATRLTRP